MALPVEFQVGEQMPSLSFGRRDTTWRKSRYSMNNGNCVEVASAAEVIMVRDSASRDALILSYSAQAWKAFVDGVKAGISSKLSARECSIS